MSGFMSPPAYGSAFPASPVDRQQFFRTDRDIAYFYDLANTRWLARQKLYVPFSISDALNPVAAAATMRGANPEYGQNTVIWIRAVLWYFISGTANYTCAVTIDKSGTSTALFTFSSFSAAGAHTGIDSGALNVSTDTTFPVINAALNRNSGTGTVFAGGYAIGRLLG